MSPCIALHHHVHHRLSPFLVPHLTSLHKPNNKQTFPFPSFLSPSFNHPHPLQHSLAHMQNNHPLHTQQHRPPSLLLLLPFSFSVYLRRERPVSHTTSHHSSQHVRVFIPRFNRNRGTNVYQLRHLPFKHARQPVHHVHPSRKHYSGRRSRPNHTHTRKRKCQHRLPTS